MGVMKNFDIRIRNGGDDAIAAVGELMPRWIPVSERLPNKHEHVIGWREGFARTAEVWIGSNGKWIGGDFEQAGEITYWMPLPEPPAA